MLSCITDGGYFPQSDHVSSNSSYISNQSVQSMRPNLRWINQLRTDWIPLQYVLKEQPYYTYQISNEQIHQKTQDFSIEFKKHKRSLEDHISKNTSRKQDSRRMKENDTSIKWEALESYVRVKVAMDLLNQCAAAGSPPRMGPGNDCGSGPTIAPRQHE